MESSSQVTAVATSVKLPAPTMAIRERVAGIYATLNPVQLLDTIRSGQQRLGETADRPTSGELLAPTAPTLEEFLAGLRTAWREGESASDQQPKEKAKRGRRRPDPLVVVTARLVSGLRRSRRIELSSR